MAQQTANKPIQRFSAAQRFEHLVITVSVLGLALTGLAQKYATAAWADTTINWLGGVESVRILHRFLAIILLIEVIYHIVVIAYRLYVLGREATMMPKGRDISDLRDWVLHSLGVRAATPRLPRYTFWQKGHYLMVAGSIIVLAITGFFMWNPIAVSKVAPGSLIPAARLAHGGLALLLTIVVLTWHLYSTSLRYLNQSMVTGRLSRRAMAQDHAEELETLDRGELQSKRAADEIEQRKRVFWPAAVVFLLAVSVILFIFVSAEDSALTTVPRQTVEIYGPSALPEEGDAAVGEVLWPTLRCGFCHGPAAGGIADKGPALSGTSLTFDAFFAQVRAGEGDMPAFSAHEIPDGYVLHLYTWLAGLSAP